MPARRLLPIIIAALLAVSGFATARTAQAQAPLTYAPERLQLADTVRDLTQCDIHVDPDAFMAAYARYCDAYRTTFTQLDEQHSRASTADEARYGVLPSVKATQRRVQEGRRSMAESVALADAFLDDLGRAVSELDQAAFLAFRDECHIQLMVARMDPDAGAWSRTDTVQDLGGWLRWTLDVTGMSSPQRKEIAIARTARSAERRAAMREMLQAVDDARLRAATLADALGVGGLTEEEAQKVMQGSPEPRDGRWVADVREAAQLPRAARYPIVAVEFDAWKLAVPHLPASARGYLASTFLRTLSDKDDDGGFEHGLPVYLDSAISSGGLSVIRTALSLPGLDASQLQSLRDAGARWRDERTVVLEQQAAAAARAEAGEPSDRSALKRVDRKWRDTLASIAHAPWLAATNESPRRGGPADVAGPNGAATLPRKEDLHLQESDNALFPIPGAGIQWNPPTTFDAGDDTQQRLNGWPPAPRTPSEVAMVRAVLLDADEQTVAASIWAEFREEWASTLPPLITAAKQARDALTHFPSATANGGSGGDAIAARGAALARASAAHAGVWAAADALMLRLAERLVAALPPTKQLAATVWTAGLRLAMFLPFGGWELNMPNLVTAAFTPFLSSQGRTIALTTLADSTEAMAGSARAAQVAFNRANRQDPSVEAGSDPLADDGTAQEDEQSRLDLRSVETRDAYLARAKRESERVAALLAEPDAAVWRSAVNAQRAPFFSASLRPVAEALPATPDGDAVLAVLAQENRALDALCDTAFVIASKLPERRANAWSGMHGPISMLHARANVYYALARDRRTVALWNLRSQMPAQVRERVPLLRPLDAIEALRATP